MNYDDGQLEFDDLQAENVQSSSIDLCPEIAQTYTECVQPVLRLRDHSSGGLCSSGRINLLNDRANHRVIDLSIWDMKSRLMLGKTA